MQNLNPRFFGQLLLEERLNCCTLTQEVGVFVELVWTEALGSLSNILTVPVSSISLNDVRMGLDNRIASDVLFLLLYFIQYICGVAGKQGGGIATAGTKD